MSSLALEEILELLERVNHNPDICFHRNKEMLEIKFLWYINGAKYSLIECLFFNRPNLTDRLSHMGNVNRLIELANYNIKKYLNDNS